MTAMGRSQRKTDQRLRSPFVLSRPAASSRLLCTHQSAYDLITGCCDGLLRCCTAVTSLFPSQQLLLSFTPSRKRLMPLAAA